MTLWAGLGLRGGAGHALGDGQDVVYVSPEDVLPPAGGQAPTEAGLWVTLTKL